MSQPDGRHPPCPILTLLTDFGWRDSYVGEVKGVLLSSCPGIHLVDLSHDIPPGNIWHGAYVLARQLIHFPGEAVHLAVVDPGVGSERKVLMAHSRHGTIVAPDNGLLTFAMEWIPDLAIRWVVTPPSGQISPTFHGRDLFAPLAAKLASGEDLDGMTRPLDRPVRLSYEPPEKRGSCWTGTVLHIDHFGNVITDIPIKELRGACRIGPHVISAWARCFAEAESGSPFLYSGSGGTMEIALPGEPAHLRLSVSRGQKVILEL
ncbi:MAG TPA: SAM-dependent chlorinase/fluorinase [Thermoanaerobaculia bacterium]|nr:SAM-dependent chlorinase/fluorinase [Thermoanaerobaculia bacterium]HUM31176.1 SAM-dependent chlorinase/fluorinase [Thermoanaerobaculia bacterium]HXK69524.1 SAM-dependent chlorinase/fluorinase [Thermoanaerobaculia bacterium]